MAASLVRVPRPAEINRILITLTELDAGDGVAKSAVFEAMSAVCLGGELPDNEPRLAFAVATGLIERAGGRLRVSKSGAALIAANPDLLYEPPAAQLPLMAQQCVLTGPYAELAEKIMNQLTTRSDADTWTLEPAQASMMDHVERSLVSFMLAVGVFRATPDVIQVTQGYVATASWLRSGRVVSPEELAEALERQRAQGAEAEEWAVVYERRRLEAAGWPVEARAVHQVSRVDVCAGYDVGSFDGPSSTLSYDRFIEVKSTASRSLNFLWSANEIAAARELGRRYWLYILEYVGGAPSALVRVMDPASKIGRARGLALKPAVFRCQLHARIPKETV